MPDPHFLPPPLSNRSIWQHTVAAHPPLSANSAAPLPGSADIVIVGGGLCGALIAHYLLQQTSTERIVLLEARELASGASGRNAGHCRPDAGRGFAMFERLHGAEQARRILESEKAVLDLADAFIREHGVECEWTRRPTYDVCLSEEFAEYAARANGAFAAAGGTPAEAVGRVRAREVSRSDLAVDAFGWDAATVNPAQLTLAVHALCARSPRFEACTHCPVTSLSPSDGSWAVDTPRGAVNAGKVVLATNAYTSALVDLGITPIQAQAHLLRSPKTPLPYSYSLRRSMKEFYSVAPRPDGSVVLGVSRLGWPADLLQSAVGNVDDSSCNEVVAQQGLDAANDVWPAERWDGFGRAWTGIIGVTPDLVPLVGPVPGKEGVFVAAGYNGHGMARIFLTAPSLAHFVVHGTWAEDDQMPECFRLTPERLERLRG